MFVKFHFILVVIIDRNMCRALDRVGNNGIAQEEAQWIQVQKKTFTKWVNQQLAPVGSHIEDIYSDFKNGINLVTLLQVLFKEPIVRYTVGYRDKI